MNDPRAKVWGNIEALAKELPEHAAALLEGKDALKAWAENEMRQKEEATSARTARDTEFETLNTEFATFKEEAGKLKAPKKGEPSAELTEMQAQYKAMEQRLNDADAATAKAENAKFMGDVKSTFLKGVNLKDDFAESKIELAIAMGNVQKAEDGTTQIVVGENKFTVESYGKHLEENHSSQLKTVSGGKQGGFNNEPAGDVNQQAKIAANIKEGTRGLVTFKN